MDLDFNFCLFPPANFSAIFKCLEMGSVWVLFFVPTYLMALDYACITFNRKVRCADSSLYPII